jgi:hypothetical protein
MKMSWDINQVLQTIASIIFGAVAGGLVSLYLQRREKETRYAIQNKEEIYIPLFDEVKRKRAELDEFRNPFNASTTLDTWAKLKPSTKLRVPDDLKALIKDFDDAGREFYNAHLKATPILIRCVNENLEAVRNELDERKYSGDNFKILKRNVFEGYAGDFYSGRILPEKRHNYSPERILKIRAGSSLTFDIFFNRVCSSIGSEEQINELRRKRTKVIDMTEHLEKYLERRIEFILEKYESRLTKV